MPLMADRVKETTTTTSTGAITLGGAVTGFEAFSAAFANPSVVYYAIVGSTTEWEVGIGTFTTTLSRDVVLASSNSDALVNFSAGSKDVFSTIPSYLANIDEATRSSGVYFLYQQGNPAGAL